MNPRRPSILVTWFVILSANGCGFLPTSLVEDVGVPLQGGDKLFITPAMVDLGTTRTTEIAVLVKLSNPTTKPIRVIDVEKSCGCISVEMPIPTDIPPGTEVKLTLKARLSKSTTGEVKQHLTIVTDEKEQGRYEIPVLGYLLGEIKTTLQPEAIDFGKVGSWSSPTRTVRLMHPDLDSLSIGRVQSTHHDLCVSYEGVKDNALLYSIKLPPDFRPGSFREEVVFETPGGSANLIVMGKKMGLIYMTSDFLVCDRSKNKSNKLVKLRHSRSTPIKDIIPETKTTMIHVLEKSLNIQDEDSLISCISMEILNIPDSVKSFDLLLKNNLSDLQVKVFVKEKD